jgi:hypothetical protein
MAGKLYILGGGWSQVRSAGPGLAIPMALAIRVAVPWDLANRQIGLVAKLITGDGEPVRLQGPDGEAHAMEATTSLEVGRPPGVAPGTPLDAMLAINIGGIPLDPGRYAWTVEIEGTPKARAPFQVLA